MKPDATQKPRRRSSAQVSRKEFEVAFAVDPIWHWLDMESETYLLE